MFEIVSDGAAANNQPIKSLNEQIVDVTSEMKTTSNALWELDSTVKTPTEAKPPQATTNNNQMEMKAQVQDQNLNLFLFMFLFLCSSLVVIFICFSFK